jgi:hypothetical protein
MPNYFTDWWAAKKREYEKAAGQPVIAIQPSDWEKYKANSALKMKLIPRTALDYGKAGTRVESLDDFLQKFKLE